MNTIEYPSGKTYYIITENGNYLGHGAVETNQVMYSAHTITAFTDDQDFINALATYNIEI